MLDNGIIKQTYSESNSPSRPDGQVRFCNDFRKVNSLSKVDTYPLPRVDDSVDHQRVLAGPTD